jgi:hypothetical protein
MSTQQHLQCREENKLLRQQPSGQRKETMHDKQPVNKEAASALDASKVNIRAAMVVICFVSLLYFLPFLRSAQGRFCVFCAGCFVTGSSPKGGHHYVRNL